MQACRHMETTLCVAILKRHWAIENLFLFVKQRRHRTNDTDSILQNIVAHFNMLSRFERDECFFLTVFEDLFDFLLHKCALLTFDRVYDELLLKVFVILIFLLSRLCWSLLFDFWLRFVFHARWLLMLVEVAFQGEFLTALLACMRLQEGKIFDNQDDSREKRFNLPSPLYSNAFERERGDSICPQMLWGIP